MSDNAENVKKTIDFDTETEWPKVKSALDLVFRSAALDSQKKTLPPDEYMRVYTLICNLCTSQPSKHNGMHVYKALSLYAFHVADELLTRVADQSKDEKELRSMYLSAYASFLSAAVYCSRLFGYYNRHWVTRTASEGTREMVDLSEVGEVANAGTQKMMDSNAGVTELELKSALWPAGRPEGADALQSTEWEARDYSTMPIGAVVPVQVLVLRMWRVATGKRLGVASSEKMKLADAVKALVQEGDPEKVMVEVKGLARCFWATGMPASDPTFDALKEVLVPKSKGKGKSAE